MKFTKSRDGLSRATIRVSHRVSIEGAAYAWVSHRGEDVRTDSKAKAADSIRFALGDGGFNVTWTGEPDKNDLAAAEKRLTEWYARRGE